MTWHGRIVALLMAAGRVSAASPSADPLPAPIKTFGNWAVACDNGLRCTAVSLQPGEGDYKGVGLVVSMDAGPDAVVTVSLEHIVDGHQGAARIAVDGRVVASRQLADDRMVLPADQASSVVDTLVAGRRLQLKGGDIASDTALDGASAAFRYMDARQGRASTATALVAKGDRSALMILSGRIPTIRAIRPTAKAPPLSEAVKTTLWARSKCERSHDQDGAFIVQSLSKGDVLVLVSCGMDSPYNHFQDPYVVHGTRIAVASFDAPVGMGERGAPPSIVTGGWDSDKATLSSYERGRALGDCASAEAFVWDGARFRLVDREELDQCRGGMSLLTSWRARPVFITGR